MFSCGNKEDFYTSSFVRINCDYQHKNLFLIEPVILNTMVKKKFSYKKVE